MNKITRDQLRDYLRSGISFEEADGLLDVLQSYTSSIKSKIEMWREYLPSTWEYRGDGPRYQRFQSIVKYLTTAGYYIAYPRKHDGGNCTWKINLGQAEGLMIWDDYGQTFSITGLPRPNEIPDCLNFWSHS